MKKILLALTLVLFSVPAMAAGYVVDPVSSHISFSGTHAGNGFTGQFKTWATEIVFDANDLKSSHIKATFDLSSAATGNMMFDGTLPQADWFDVKDHPQGVFASTAITHKQGDVYHADGTLTLRGVTKPLGFDFTISDLKDKLAKVKGTLTVDRLTYGIGQQSDPKAEWVSKDIQIDIDLSASVQP